MSPDVFDELLNLIEEDITRQNTHLQDPIPATVKTNCYYKVFGYWGELL